MMNPLKDIEWTPANILKAAGAVLLAIIVVSVFWGGEGGVRQSTSSVDSMMPMPPMFSVSTMPGFEDGANYAEKDVNYGSARLSLTNVGMPVPTGGGTVGGDAEKFEVTDYSVSIETRDKHDTCTGIAKLKELTHVVFESANEHDRGCSYSFKVEHAHIEEVLAILKTYDPKNLSENTYTIKRQLDDFTSESDILKKKLTSIDQTLTSAVDAYDDISTLAIRTQDAEALAKIIDSKITIIERLAQERINVSAQLERLERAKAEQLDKLTYTYFYVDVYENKFVDGESIHDSWKAAIRTFVVDVNRVVQDVTINLIALILLAVQYVLYLLVLLVIAKYVWRAAQYIWKK
ncbi:MAG: hypothetical protein AAB573_04520 [Patescibacteria group bacterium]